MRRVRRPAGQPGPRRGEDGNAIVEFVFLAVVLLVPLIYLVLVTARLQAASYAVSLAAREGGRAFVTSLERQDPQVRARAAADLAFEDQGFAAAEGALDVTCAAAPCLTPGAQVAIRAGLRVPLPLVPGFLQDTVPLVVPVEAGYVITVNGFRSP